jgi:hypothetical protein
MAKAWTNGTITVSTIVQSTSTDKDGAVASITFTHHSAQANGRGDRT